MGPYLLLLLLSLGLFSLARLALFIAYYSKHFHVLSGAQIFDGFIEGLRFDASGAWTFLSLPLLILLLLPFKKSRVQQLMLRVGGWLFYVILLLECVILILDIYYFRIVGRHMADEILTLGSDIPFLIDTLKSAWIRTLAFGALSLGGAWAFRRCLNPALWISPQSKTLTISKRLLILILIFLGIRGGTGLKPLAPIDAYVSGSPIELVQLKLNGLFNFWHSALLHTKAGVRREKRLSPAELSAALGGIEEATPKGELSPKSVDLPKLYSLPPRPNIVFFLLESWGTFYVDFFGKQNFGVTPNFDQIAREGLSFSHYFACGSRSIEAIQIVHTGFPSLSGLPILGHGFEDLAPTMSGRALSELGMASLFMQSAPRQSFRLNAVAAALGFEHYAGHEDFSPILDYGREPTPTFGWDYEGFMHLKKTLDGVNTPFFAFYFSGTTHAPYARPPGLAAKAPHGSDEESGLLNTLRYSDQALGDFMAAARKSPWFDQTIFIFTADHTLGAYRKFPQEAFFSVPLVIYAPSMIAPEIRSDLSSHMDLLPTMLHILGYKKPVTMPGRSLFHTRGAPDTHVILGGAFDQPAILNQELYLKSNGHVRFENSVRDPSCLEACIGKWEQTLIGRTQLWYDTLLHRRPKL